MEIGYFLSSEEHEPNELVRQAQQAAEAGIRSVSISDHYHPWLDEQGQSPFVWSVIGGIAATTELHVTTAVTCPNVRIHPAIVAQAAATCAVMLEGRFALGVGTGEYLNEHVLGDPWPEAPRRIDMLEEAVELMRALWSGEAITRRGTHYTVLDAQVFTRPSVPPPVYVSAFGPKAVDAAAAIADGYVNTSPDADLVKRYRDGGGRGPVIGSLKLCYSTNREKATDIVHRVWRSSGVPGQLSQELRSPALFEQASELVTPESLVAKMPAGPDVAPIVEQVQRFIDAGFDRVDLCQIGPDQGPFFRFFERELGPVLAGAGAAVGGSPVRAR